MAIKKSRTTSAKAKTVKRTSAKPKKLSGEVFYPSKQVIEQARLEDWDKLASFAKKDFRLFWENEAKELEWYGKWKKVLDDSKKPFFKWFTGAKVNIVHNAIDRHLKNHYKNKLALIWESEDGRDHRTYSYYAMNREVTMANIIKAMGVTGHRANIIGRVPDRLPCWRAKIGASTRWCPAAGGLFAGRTKTAVETRITCDGSFQNGKVVQLKSIVTRLEALSSVRT
jgi:acetyl-CoA synthetase